MKLRLFCFFLLVFLCVKGRGSSSPDTILENVQIGDCQHLLDSSSIVNIDGEIRTERKTLFYNTVYKQAKSLSLRGDVEQALNLMQCLNYFSETEGRHEQAEKLKVDIGIIYYNWGQYDKALKYFIEALSASKRHGYSKIEAEALNYIGKYYHTRGDFKTSYNYYEKALRIAVETKDTLRIAALYNNIGRHFSDYGEISRSLKYCLKSYTLQENKVVDYEVFATTCNHLGNLYLKLDEYDKALKFHYKALSHRKSINYSEGIGKSYLNISKVFFDMQKIDSAAYYCNEALVRLEYVNYKKGLIKVYSQLGKICRVKGHVKDAENYFTKALKISQQVNYEKGIMRSLLSVANLYQQSGKYYKATDYYNRSLSMAKSSNIKEVVRDSYKGLQTCYENLKDYRKANEAGKQYYLVSEQLLKESAGRQIAHMRVEYETEAKEKENKLLISENKLKTLKIRQKNLLILLSVIGFLLVSIVATVLFNRYSKKRKDNKKLEELNYELTRVNREKDRFFSIIAHEIRNPLWWFKNITETLSKNFESMRRVEVVESLSAMDESAKNTFLLMDNLLHWTRSRLDIIPNNPAPVKLNSQIDENIQLFHTMLKHKKIELKLELVDVMVYIDMNHLNTILRNVFSNAIKFTPEGGRINISSLEHSGKVLLKVEDNGVGIESSMVKNIFDEKKSYTTIGLMQEKGTGIGLKLCKEFVEKSKGSLDIISELKKGTTVAIELPVYFAERECKKSKIA